MDPTGNFADGNETGNLPAYPKLDHPGVIKSAILLLIFTFSLASNLRALHKTVTTEPGAPNTSLRMLLLHLITADLMVTGFCQLGSVAWMLSVEFHGGDVLCRLFKFSQAVSLSSSTYVTLVIAVSRAAGLLRPWHWQYRRRRRRLAGLLVAAWTAGIAVSIPQLFLFGVARGPWARSFHQCVSIELRPLPQPLASYANRIVLVYMLFNLVSQFLLPAACMCVCYALILKRIAEHSMHQAAARMEASAQSAGAGGSDVDDIQTHCHCAVNRRAQRRSLLARARVSASRMFSTIVLVFVLLWLPYWILYAAACANRLSGGRHKAAIDFMSHGMFFFGMCVSAVNPVIYGAYYRRRGSDSHPEPHQPRISQEPQVPQILQELHAPLEPQVPQEPRVPQEPLVPQERQESQIS